MGAKIDSQYTSTWTLPVRGLGDADYAQLATRGAALVLILSAGTDGGEVKLGGGAFNKPVTKLDDGQKLLIARSCYGIAKLLQPVINPVNAPVAYPKSYDPMVAIGLDSAIQGKFDINDAHLHQALHAFVNKDGSLKGEAVRVFLPKGYSRNQKVGVLLGLLLVALAGTYFRKEIAALAMKGWAKVPTFRTGG